MNEEGKKINIVIPLIILFIVLILVIIITVLINDKRKEKPITIDYTTTTQVVDNKEILNNGSEPVIVTNFQASLKTIDPYSAFTGIDVKQIKYKGAIFNYKCTSSNESVCLSGSLTMNVGTTMLPLYVFNYENENYGTHPFDLFIAVTDENILLAYNNNRIVKIKLYTRSGQFLSEINDAMFYYSIGGNEVGPSYPSLSSKVSYYTCIDNNIYLKSVNISNINDVLMNAKIEGANCS